MDTNQLPCISIVPRPNKIKVISNKEKNRKISSASSPNPYAKSSESISSQSTSSKVEKIPHGEKQIKIPLNMPSITDNSVTPKIEPTKTKTPMSKPLIFVLVTISLIAMGALAFGLYSFIEMSKTTTTTTIATSGLKWCSTTTTVVGTGYGGCQVTQLQDPWYIVFDSNGAIYIADSACHRISKWIIGSLTGTIVAGQLNGMASNTSTFLNRPYGVSVDSNNNIYIADTNNHRVQFWPSGASSGYTIAGTTGTNGSALNQLSSPYSIALDPNSNTFYVADAGNHRILKFIFNVTTGTIAAGGQGQGTGINQLSFPTNVYFDSVSNSLFITNMNAHSVVQWVLGASVWKLVAGTPGSYGYTSFMLNTPQGVTLDSAGNIYVADTNNHRIQFFRPGNSIGTTIAGSLNTPGASSSLLESPRSVLLDKQLNLYVSDTNNDRIQMFPRC